MASCCALLALPLGGCGFIAQANLREAPRLITQGVGFGGGWEAPCPAPCVSFLGISLFLVVPSLPFLLCPPSLLSNPGETLARLGWQTHPGSARGAPAMAAAEVNADADLEQIIPMKKVRGSILHNFSMLVREALKVDQCILCNSCWLCRGCEVTRLLPYGWHKDYCAARTQLCTSVLSRISGQYTVVVSA